MKLEKTRKLIKFKHLKDLGKILVLCLKKEYKTYILIEKEIDSEKTILGKPLLATFVPKLFRYMNMYMDGEITRIHEEFVNDMVQNFVNKASHLSITFKNSTEAATTTEMTHTGTTMDNDNTMDPQIGHKHMFKTHMLSNLLFMIDLMMCLLNFKKLMKQIGMNTPQHLGLEIKQSLRQPCVKS